MSNQAQVNPFFTPTQISGCSLWLDAADRSTFTLSGSNITMWNDKSGSNYNGSNTGTVIYTRFNGYPMAYFNNNGGILGSYINSGTTISCFAIYVPQNGGPSGAIDNTRVVSLTTTAGVQDFLNNQALGAIVLDINNGGTPYSQRNISQVNATFPYSLNQLNLATSVFTGSTGNVWSQGQGRGSASFSGNFGITLYGIGSYAGFNQANVTFNKLTGFVGEVIIYNNALNDLDRQQVEGYLAWKWGLQASLPANHPYKSSPIPPLLNPPTSLPTFNQNTSIVNWSPFQIPGCTVWLDAADRTTLSLTGTTVNSWSSKVSSLPLLASSVGFGSIIYSNFNNLPSLYFNGTNTKMTTGTIPSYGTTGTTWITVSANFTPITSTTPVDSSAIIATLQGTSPERSIRYQYLNQFTIYCINNGFLRGVIDENTNGIRGFSDQSASFVAYVNGNIARNDTNPATYQAGVNQAFQLGQWGSSGHLLGHIQEVIIYNSRISLSQYQTVEGYLAWKWSLQGLLPASHPFKNNPPLGNPLAPPARSLFTYASWLPTQISGCSLWLDAADTNTITASATITGWTDKSGTSRTVTFSGTNNTYNRQTISVNTDNVTNSYFHANVNLKKSVIPYASVFLVHTWIGSVAAGNQALWGQDIGGGWNRFQLLSFVATPSYAYGLSYTPNSPNVVAVSSLNTPNRILYNANYAYLVPNGTYVNLNGSLASSYVTEAVSPSETSTTNTYFGTIDTGYSGRVAFHEILIYTTNLTLIQRQTIEGYLAWKWGLQGSLPASHPFKRWPPPP